MPGFMLAHAGDASGLGMLAFIPVGLLLVIGLIIVLRPTVTGTGLQSAEDEDEDSAQDARPESDKDRR
jgi:hypothetical protein